MTQCYESQSFVWTQAIATKEVEGDGNIAMLISSPGLGPTQEG